ncbi:hypothetical protein BGX34_005335 [Mortierella sp. NVP85]|nr:hypothetical protein BGX34_005335 [Mortierella sp. NVP85]
MSQHNALIYAYGKGSARITFYDNLQNPTDSEDLVGTQAGPYVFSVGWFRNEVKKYGFSLANKGFISLTVSYAGKTYNVTDEANGVAFDFWNTNTFKPTKTDAPNSQSVGGVILISEP